MKPGAFAVWSYRRPVGHSKSRAVRSGDAPSVVEWAFAPIVAGVILTSSARSGFPTRDAAEAAAPADER